MIHALLNSSFLGLLFPRHCLLCQNFDESQLNEYNLCETCCDQILDSFGFCKLCGTQLLENENALSCHFCRDKKFKFSNVYCLGSYKDLLKSAILQTKTQSGMVVTVALAKILADQLKKTTSDIDLIVPIPVYWTRRVRHGYHSPEVISRVISQKLGIKRLHRLISMSRNPRKQSDLRFSARRQNVYQAYHINKGYDIADKNILVVDDILTSGATMSEAARVLLGAGAKKISVAVLGRAVIETKQ